MRRAETVTFTNMCMITDGNGHVVVQNRNSQSWPGITFPGGHVEFGESFTDAVIREVREETGLTVSQLRLCGVKDWMQNDGSRYVVFLYRTSVFEGELTSSSEGEIWWEDIRNLPKLKLTRGMLTTLRLFLEEDLSEQFFYKENDQMVEVLK